jgi:uncharacterized metal-binding protein YceD (DUF177 family)
MYGPTLATLFDAAKARKQRVGLVKANEEIDMATDTKCAVCNKPVEHPLDLMADAQVLAMGTEVFDKGNRGEDTSISMHEGVLRVTTTSGLALATTLTARLRYGRSR